MKLQTLSLFALAATALVAAEPVFKDSFTEATAVPERRAMRGDWQIAEGIAKCIQDDELYKKNKDHGPILFYDLPTKDATHRFAFKPSGCETVVFTLNGEGGHVFRMVTSARGSGFRAFPPGDEKSIQTRNEPEWKLAEGTWTEVMVTLKGPTATVKFGDREAVTVEHESYAAAKVNFSLGFSFGTLEVKEISVGE